MLDKRGARPPRIGIGVERSLLTMLSALRRRVEQGDQLLRLLQLLLLLLQHGDGRSKRPRERERGAPTRLYRRLQVSLQVVQFDTSSSETR